MTKGSPQVTEEISIHMSNKTLANTLTHTMEDAICFIQYCLQKTLRLTRVDLLQGDVLLQLPTEFDLRAILPAGAIVSQDEV